MYEAIEKVIKDVKQSDANQLFTGERFVPGIANNNLETEHIHRYLSVCDLVKGKRVVDAACGEGYGSRILSDFAESVIGIDIDKETIERASKKYELIKNIKFLVSSVEKLEVDDNSIDVVISFETIEHVDSDTQNGFLSEIKRVLKDNGILVMSTPNKAIYSDLHGYKNPFHVKEFYYYDFVEFLKREFKTVVLYNQSFEIVSILTRIGINSEEIKYYSNDNREETEGKYFVAVASNNDISEEKISSAFFFEAGALEKTNSRIVQLQQEEELRNQHISSLDNEIYKYQERINELQNKEEERNQHIQHLDGEINGYNKRIEELQQEEEKRNQHIRRLDDEILKSNENTEKLGIELEIKKKELEISKQEFEIVKQELEENKKELELSRQRSETIKQELEDKKQKLELSEQELEEKNQKLKLNEQELEEKNQKLELYKEEIEENKQILRNKEGHIEQLLEVEREYEREKKSKTYRLAIKFRNVFAFFLPKNSKRRFFIKVLVNCVRHPRLMSRMITVKRIKCFFSTLNQEGMEGVFKRYKEAEELEKSHLDFFDAKMFKVTEVNEIAENQKNIDEYEIISFEEYKKPTVSIIIPVFNQFDYTYQCLASIKEQSKDVSYEIIIADDCSTDLTEQIKSIVNGIKVVRNKSNLRFLKNSNKAAKYARGEYILFLNNDTQVQENWLEPLVSLMKDETIGMVGSKLVYADGWLQEAGGIIWKDASAWNYGNRQNPNDSEFNYVRETDYISGAAIMIRHSLWKEIGGFDERFTPAYCEDSDLAFEVRKHGYKVVYQPKSVVVHFEGVSNGTDLTSGQKKYQVDNQKKFFEKWKNVLEKENLENGQEIFFARGRSKGKKHILFLDHYVPTYDRDAGSKTTMMYLKMLVSKGYQITFWPDNFYQEEPYTTELQQMGIMVLYGTRYAQDWKQWLKDNLNNFDIIYLNRPHITIKYIDIIKSIPHKGKIIYYGHDLHFLRSQREFELTHDNKKLQESKEWKKQELYIMMRTDMNYYPSMFEKEAIKELNPNIPVKDIKAYVFDSFKEVSYEINNREGLLFVGGFGHVPNIDAVLWFIEKIYPEVYKRTKAPFYIVGAKAPQEIKDIKQEGVVFKGSVTEDELEELYSFSRLDIVPLRYGAGVKGKVVEALYNGIPLVTTSVGAEGIDGLDRIAIVKDEIKDLINAICDIYNDEKALSYMSKKELEYVKTQFSKEAVWEIVKDDFQ